MPWTFEHLKWLVDTGERLKTTDGKDVQIWEFNHQKDQEILSAWAKHFRNHYCLDVDIDVMRLSQQPRADYLTEIKFPSKTSKLGPGIRAGDFGEILCADYLEYVLGYWVPRMRWDSKMIRDESAKGCDVLGFKFYEEGCSSPKDILAVIEAKTKFSNSTKNRMVDAVRDSAKDHLRIAESLNYIKQRFRQQTAMDKVKVVERFQTPVDDPYKEVYGAAALYTDTFYSDSEVTLTDTGSLPKSEKNPKTTFSHPHRDQLMLIVIKGPDMMQLVHDLYQRAADEA